MAKVKDIVVCARITSPLMLPDNKIGTCDTCGSKVQFRPHAPRGKRRCVECAIDTIESDTQIETTPRMIDDYFTWRKRKRQ